MAMKVDLDVYRKQFALGSAKFERVDHADTIVAEVYRVLTSDKKSFILKICPRKEHYFREVYFLRRLDKCIPVPQIMATCEPASDHFGAVLIKSLKGQLLKKDDWSLNLAFEIGVALAHLHEHRREGYGDISKPPILFPKPTIYFNEKFEEELEECKGHLPKNLIENCLSYLSRCQSLLANVDGPCFVHRDFRPGNLIIWRGRLQGILDWSSARFGFAEQDFCSWEHFQWIPHLEYKKALLEGYSSIRLVPNYLEVMPLLRLGRSLAVIGYTLKTNTWNNSNAYLYQFNRAFLEKFEFIS